MFVLKITFISKDAKHCDLQITPVDIVAFVFIPREMKECSLGRHVIVSYTKNVLKNIDDKNATNTTPKKKQKFPSVTAK